MCDLLVGPRDHTALCDSEVACAKVVNPTLTSTCFISILFAYVLCTSLYKDLRTHIHSYRNITSRVYSKLHIIVASISGIPIHPVVIFNIFNIELLDNLCVNVCACFFKSYTHRIHVTGIFTYMKTIKSSHSCRQIFQSHGSLGGYESICKKNTCRMMHIPWGLPTPWLTSINIHQDPLLQNVFDVFA